MALKSMTGFARSDGRHGQYSWHWEMRTVNGRGLDLRLRLAPGFEPLEQPVREACKKHLARGNCSLALTVQRDSGEAVARLNEDVFKQVARAAERARGMVDAGAPTLDGLLSMRGVIEYTEEEESEAEKQARLDAVLASLDAVLDAVIDSRTSEGAHLAAGLNGLLDEIGQQVRAIENAPGRTPEAIGKRLKEQLARLMEEAPQLDEQRLHQEAALLATKADVEEELVRLKAHIDSARALLASDEPAGRRLEFLIQEFNREANTICSKSNDTDITQAGLALKTAIDRMREQVQNIE